MAVCNNTLQMQQGRTVGTSRLLWRFPLAVIYLQLDIFMFHTKMVKRDTSMWLLGVRAGTDSYRWCKNGNKSANHLKYPAFSSFKTCTFFRFLCVSIPYLLSKCFNFSHKPFLITKSQETPNKAKAREALVWAESSAYSKFSWWERTIWWACTALLLGELGWTALMGASTLPESE